MTPTMSRIIIGSQDSGPTTVSLDTGWKICQLTILPIEQINAIDIIANICLLRHSTHGCQRWHQARQKGPINSNWYNVQLWDKKKMHVFNYTWNCSPCTDNWGHKLDTRVLHKATHHKCPRPNTSSRLSKKYHDGHNKRFYWIIKLSNLQSREESYPILKNPFLSHVKPVFSPSILTVAGF